VLAQKFADQGYIDDAGFALSKARSLSGRGYGKARLVQSLKAAGVTGEAAAGARDHAEAHAVDAAIRFARRRRIGPFAASAPDPQARSRALAAMVRAGHGFELSRAILALPPGGEAAVEKLGELFGD
jgi:regulatory protein